MAKSFQDFKEETKNEGWFRLKPGENKVRILSGYEVLAQHFFGKGEKPIVCVGKDKGCRFHGEKDRVTAKYLMWIIDRGDNQIKIGEFPYTVVKAVADMKESEDYAFDNLPDYDLVITKTGEGLGTEYSVIPRPKRFPLTKEETMAFEDKEDIEKIVDKMKKKVLLEKETTMIVKDEDEINPNDIAF